MKTIINTEATRYDYGMDGLREYLWDGKLSNEEIEDKADEVMSTVINILWHNGWEWDASSGNLEYDDEDFKTSEDAVAQFLEDKETYIEMVVHDAEKTAEEGREMELAGFCREMISLGWTLDSFDEDFDRFESDEVSKDEKETCRKVFTEVWEDVQEEILDKAPDTCILRGSDLSEIRINNIILDWGNEIGITEEQVDELRSNIVTYVNSHLPDYMVWSPETSEIMGKKGQELTLEDFNELLDKAFNKYLA